MLGFRILGQKMQRIWSNAVYNQAKTVKEGNIMFKYILCSMCECRVRDTFRISVVIVDGDPHHLAMMKWSNDPAGGRIPPT